ESAGGERLAHGLGLELAHPGHDRAEMRDEEVARRQRIAEARQHLEGRAHVEHMIALNEPEAIVVETAKPHRASPLSHPEIAVLQLDVLAQRLRRPVPDDLALLQNIVALRDTGQRIDVLVDDEDRLARRLERAEAAPDLAAHPRRQPLRRLIENEKPR